MDKNKDMRALIIFISLCILTGVISSFIMSDGLDRCHPCPTD